MLSDKLVSVIIPAYNHENYIENCIRSIAEQTYSQLELVIVNDGSTDGTHAKILPLIKLYKDRFVNVVYHDRGHRGTGATLNELIALAQGEFLFQSASDDMAKPEAIQTLWDFMSGHPNYALAVGDNEIIDSSGRRVYWDSDRNNVEDESLAVYKTFGDFLHSTRKNINFHSDQFGSIDTLLNGNYIPNGKMFRKSALLAVGGYREGVVEDWYINIQLAKRYKMKYFDAPLFSYRWHAANTIKNKEYMKKVTRNMRWFVKAERIKLAVRRLLRLLVFAGK